MNAGIPIIKLIEAMNDQPIAFNKHYVFIGCGINGALMLSQLVYWSSRTKKRGGWIYKTHQEWTQETGLTRREQDTARKTLKSLGFLTEKKQGVPCKVYFKVEHEKLYQALMDYAQSLDTSQLHNSAKLDAPKRQARCTDTPDCMHNSAKLDAQISPSITENTYREYTENTPESVCADAHEKSEPKAQAKKSESENPKHIKPDKPKRVTKKQIGIDRLVELGCDEKYAHDWMVARKGAELTDSIIENLIEQANKANVSIATAVQWSAKKGYQGFKADWYLKDQQPQQGYQPPKKDINADYWASFAQPAQQQDWSEPIDVTPKKTNWIEGVGHA